MKVNPLLILGAAGAGLLLMSGKKSEPGTTGASGGSSSEGSSGDGGGSEGGGTPSAQVGGAGGEGGLLLPGDYGEPWEQCSRPKDGPETGLYAYGGDGLCMMFWDPAKRSAQAIVNTVKLQEYKGTSIQEICAYDENQKNEFIRKCVVRGWPELESASFPPNSNTKYFPKTAWGIIEDEVLSRC